MTAKVNPTNEFFNIFARKTKIACKLCFDEAYEALVLEEEANVQILRNGVQDHHDFARGEEFLKNLR